KRGFEIALHNIGDGAFSREEILKGLEIFRETIGHYPRAQANHVSNPDNIYWGRARFEWPISAGYGIVARLRGGGRLSTSGEDPESPHFWGDVFKERIEYIRNLTFGGIDTLACDPRMPYRVESKSR